MSRRSIKAGLAVGALSCAAAVACQPYNMEGVNPQTIVAVQTTRTFVGSKPPVLLIVQDRSGSMKDCFGDEAALPGETGCSTGPTTIDPNGRSRMQIARDVMRSTLESHLDDAFYGLLVYGVGSNTCGEAELTVPVNTLEAPRTTAELIRQAYDANPNITAPLGGTPSSAALAAAYDALVTQDGEQRFADRPNYVVLITDGLMNCNGGFAGTCICSQENGCAGTTFGQEMINPVGTNKNFCLDDVAATQQVNLLNASGIQTFVIGLGESFGDNPLAITTLNTLSEAGGRPRVPPADDVAQRTFYPADNREALQASITEIIDSITAPCEYELDGPVCEGRLVAINLSIDGTPVATTCNAAYADAAATKSWFFTDGTAQRITFSEDVCSALRVATSVDVSIRGVETACPTNADGSTIPPACKLGE